MRIRTERLISYGNEGQNAYGHNYKLTTIPFYTTILKIVTYVSKYRSFALIIIFTFHMLFRLNVRQVFHYISICREDGPANQRKD